MTITNPPSERKKLKGLTTYLYIYTGESWASPTIVYEFDSVGCYRSVDTGTWEFEDDTTINTDSTGAIIAV